MRLPFLRPCFSCFTARKLIYYKCKDCGRMFRSSKGCKIHVIKKHLTHTKNPSYRKGNNIDQHIESVWL